MVLVFEALRGVPHGQACRTLEEGSASTALAPGPASDGGLELQDA